MGTYDKKLYKILGEHLRVERERKKLSLEYVADKIGKTKKTISRYELGEHRVDTDTIMNICKTLGIDYYELNRCVEEEMSRNSQSPRQEITNVDDAMLFIIQNPTVAAHGGYDIERMTDEEKIEFANQISDTIKFFGQKYKK